MKLFEITNGQCGESYVRAYVWARDEEAARVAYTRTHFPQKLWGMEELLDSEDAAFVTAFSDSGFGSREEMK